MSLKQTLECFTATGALLHGNAPSAWAQGRTTYGGMTATLCLKAAEHFSVGRPLRSALIGFVGPSAGLLSVSAKLVRTGKNATSVRSTLSSSLGPGVEALFTFSESRRSALDHKGVEAPVPAPRPRDQGLPASADAPTFTQNLEFILVTGAIPFTGGSDPIVRAWIRHRDPESREHPLSLMCLADALPPAVSGIMSTFAPNSTMSWMVDFIDEKPTTDGGWWLLESKADFVFGGHSAQDMTIWNTNGQCVARGRQMITVFV